MICALCNEPYVKGSSISFHGFPKNQDSRSLWLQACKLPGTIPKQAKLCSKHFTIEDFQVYNTTGSRLLKSTAVPSQNMTRIVKSSKSFQLGKSFIFSSNANVIQSSASTQSNENIDTSNIISVTKAPSTSFINFCSRCKVECPPDRLDELARSTLVAIWD
ncbi:uncharacterized protein LOC116171320 isoform X1 [Photinus pyralis]|uniref:uncharacterized protein LOC116171320 isoform X1 n=1 Tax=Photinus pyralis TaxID=7054 RepID=UPI00126778DE|nr:uncharacterized protein LOC116171320 isoform X1 [Photinus pyralis]